MNDEHKKHIIKLLYFAGIAAVAVGIALLASLSGQQQDGGQKAEDEFVVVPQGKELTKEEKRIIEERINKSAAPVTALSEEEKQAIENNFKKEPAARGISDEDEMKGIR